MKTLIIRNLHGDENPPREFSGIPAIIGNPEAMRKNVRFIDSDLNRSFGKRNKNAKGYEKRRAQELTKLMKDFDVVIDIHRTTAPFAKFTAIITKPEHYKYTLPFHPEYVVVMRHAKYSLIGNAKVGISLEYPTHVRSTSNEKPIMMEALDFVEAKKGYRDFKPIVDKCPSSNQTSFPFLVGEKAYNGKCFLCKIIQ